LIFEFKEIFSKIIVVVPTIVSSAVSRTFLRSSGSTIATIITSTAFLLVLPIAITTIIAAPTSATPTVHNRLLK
jgi:hypothetical protein